VKILIQFWFGSITTEIIDLARQEGFQFDQVITIDSHWMTPPDKLDYVIINDFNPSAYHSYVVITNKAEHNQLIPVIAKLTLCGADFEAYEFFDKQLRQLWPLPQI